MRDELISKSTRVVDKLTIELVGMLFDHVMQDKQVPSEIKARISRLQFPVLKSALMRCGVASSAHPARKLIDRIAGTSAGWEPYGDDDQRSEEVDRVITEILEHFEPISACSIGCMESSTSLSPISRPRKTIRYRAPRKRLKPPRSTRS